MQMEIIDRHFTLGEDQRELIEAALEKLERFSPRPLETVKVVINHDAGLFDADGVLFLKSREFRAKGEGREPELAVGEMVENLRTQLIKFKGKMTARQKSESGGLGRAMVEGGGALPAPAENPHTFILKDMSVEDAREAFQTANQPFLVFRNAKNGRVAVIYSSDDGSLGHMEAGQ
ncbi:hypothetical protein CO151_03460 [bacterium CG_4_9_14_3_um_filter_65_15]|nr:MAG: hypothetical protein CO151_03460 [bacterium CG_4_9_14_3_um_filter_65_15]